LQPLAVALTAGTRLGPYQIVSLIGAGGMGDVYRARDTRLGRDVALKVLPEAFLADAERIARFEREAKAIASFNHPNIGAIHGLEESHGIAALVLELVEGPTLAHRIAGEPIPLHEALSIARQIAQALDAAHERGIVHRDLKPGNIVLTAEGVAKVLDFGLAKIASSDAGPAAVNDLTRSPTALGPTGEGVLLGTAPYMSPEQARGKAVDKRTDVWAFGCVLFEMLTGRRAFSGETSSDTIAAILERQPDWTQLPSSTPPATRRLLRRCLEKDPRRRLRDIADVHAELDDESATAAAAPPTSPRSVTRTMAVAVATSIIGSVIATTWWLRDRQGAVARHPMQFSFAAPDGVALAIEVPVVSPDGTRIAFAVRSSSGQRSLWIRRLDSGEMRPLAGTDDVVDRPVWSPDGRWLGFFAGGRLKKVDPSGGPVLNIATIQNNLGATWNRDNVIIIAPVNRTVLHRVSASGGTPEPITTLNADRRENSHRRPYFLPDGRHFLFTARSDVKENNMIYLGSLDSREVRPLFAAQSPGIYAPPGYILYAQEGTVMARAFDAAALTVLGDAVPVAAEVNHNTPSAEASFSVSADGSVLAFLANVTRNATITWFDRTGNVLGTAGPEKEYSEVRLSPDGKTAGVVIPDFDSGNRDIWLVDLSVGSLARFTSHPANDWQMAWSPGGTRIAFASDRNGPSSVYVKPVAEGSEELLVRLPDRGAFPKDFSQDGRFLTLGIDTPAGVAGVWAMPLAGDRTPFPLSNVTVRENQATLTRDGRWYAFESQQSGTDEIYVAPFPKGARRRVSTGGGFQPRWRADGRELYYAAPNGDIMAVTVRTTDPIELAVPVRLFSACGGLTAQRPGSGGGGLFDVTANGARFLMACSGPASKPAAITVSVDWAASVRASQQD
jgi:eukaryotic-like serine/threonine-protein kinase